MIADNRPCVFNTHTSNIIDFVRTTETNEQALVRLFEYGPGLVVLPIDEAWQRHEDAAKSPPVEITEERWHEMLNVLPPVAWHRTCDGESFKISERTTGMITAIFVRLNGRFFEFSDSIRTPHQECCKRVFESEAYSQATRE